MYRHTSTPTILYAPRLHRFSEICEPLVCVGRDIGLPTWIFHSLKSLDFPTPQHKKKLDFPFPLLLRLLRQVSVHFLSLVIAN